MAYKKKSERVQKMTKNFMSLREQGMSIQKIADKFSLHYTTVYDELEAIAKANNTSRNELLYHPHSVHSPACKKTQHAPVEELINIEETTSAFDKAITDIEIILKHVDQILEKEQEITK